MANNNETTTKFKADISELKTQFQEAKRQIRLANSEFKAATSGMDKWSDSADGISAKLKQLNSVLDAQKEQLKSLERQYELVVAEQGEDSKGAEELKIKINNQKAAVGETEKQIRNYNAQLEMLGTDTAEATKDTKNLNDGFTVMKGVVSDLVSAGIKALIQGLKDVAKYTNEAYKEFDKGYENLIKATGATGDSAKAIEDSYKNVAKSVKGNMSDIGAAVGEVNTRFGYTGERLEKLSERFLKFADINNVDVVKSVDDTQKAISAYGLSLDDAEHYLDILTKTSQNTGVSTDKLNSGIISNATAFQEMGLNIDQAVSFMGQLEKSGANSETVLNGMRKALKNSAENGLDLNAALIELQRSIENDADSTGALTAAYDLFGKSGDQIYGAIKNGTLSFEELTKTSQDVTGAVDDTYEQTQDAFDKISLAAQGLKADIASEFKGVLNEYGPEIDAIVEKVKNFVAGALDHFIKDILPNIKSGIEWTIDNLPIIEALIVGIGAAFAAWKVVGIITAVTTALKGMSAAEILLAAKQAILNAVMLANPIGLVIAAIVGLVAAFVVLWNKSEKFRKFWTDLWEVVKSAAGLAWAAISRFFVEAWEKVKEIWGGISEFFSNLWESIKSVFSTIATWIDENVFQPIMEFFQPVIDFFTTAWNIIKELAAGCWELIKITWQIAKDWFNEHVIQPVKKFFTDLWEVIKTAATLTWDRIKNAWSVVSGWFNEKIITPVKNFFTGMWNGLKDGASNAWTGIKNVFAPVADWFKEKFSKAWQKVKDVFSTGGKIFDGIKEGITNAFKTVVNAIIRGINRVIAIPFNAINNTLDRIRDIEIAGYTPFDGLISRFDVPQIPELARGGVLKKGQKGFLEGDGAEAVVPLEKNTDWLDEIAARLYDKMDLPKQFAMAGPQTTTTVNNFYQTNNSPKALSRLEIYRQSKNLLRMKR